MCIHLTELAASYMDMRFKSHLNFPTTLLSARNSRQWNWEDTLENITMLVCVLATANVVDERSSLVRTAVEVALSSTPTMMWIQPIIVSSAISWADPLSHWQPMERPAHRSSVNSAVTKTDDSDQLVLCSLKDVERPSSLPKCWKNRKCWALKKSCASLLLSARCVH